MELEPAQEQAWFINGMENGWIGLSLQRSLSPLTDSNGAKFHSHEQTVKRRLGTMTV
jgi:hypothetical protein